MSRRRSPSPSSTAVLNILLALAKGDLHGLGIAQEVERVSDGAVRLGPGTLYRSLKEMTHSGLVCAVEAPDPASDPRRKYYRVTADGKRLLRSEAERLARLVEVARERRVLKEPV